MAIRFVIEGDLRFISHHDTMRLFERALSRAQLPVKFSQGFNPRPRLSLPLPRAVGIASAADLLVVDLDEGIEPTDAVERLNSQMPAGLTLVEAWTIADKRPPQPVRVDYELPLPPEHVDAVSEAIHRVMTAATWNIERAGPGRKKAKSIDLRQYLEDASVREGTLRWTVSVTAEGSLRPAELLAAVGLKPEDWHHRVRRTGVCWGS